MSTPTTSPTLATSAASPGLGKLGALAFELREKIFALALDDPTVAVPTDIFIPNFDRIWQPPGLFQVSHQVTDEALSALYIHKRFIFEIGIMTQTRRLPDVEQLSRVLLANGHNWAEETYYRTIQLANPKCLTIDLSRVKNIEIKVVFDVKIVEQITPSPIPLSGFQIRSWVPAVRYPPPPSNNPIFISFEEFLSDIFEPFADPDIIRNNATIILEWPEAHAQFASSRLMRVVTHFTSFRQVILENYRHNAPSPLWFLEDFPARQPVKGAIELACEEYLGPVEYEWDDGDDGYDLSWVDEGFTTLRDCRMIFYPREAQEASQRAIQKCMMEEQAAQE